MIDAKQARVRVPVFLEQKQWIDFWLPLIVSCVLALCTASSAQATPSASQPWRLSQALNLPSWLRLSGQHQLRYETLEGQFRPGRQGNDHILAYRTALKATVSFDRMQFVAEMLDARQEFADEGTPLNTGIVNTFDLLQGHAAMDFADLFQPGSQSQIKLGRFTLDLGSRRLMARNRYRNTINSFTGIHTSWTAASGYTLQAFYSLPVQREPTDSASLLDNDTEFDKEDFDLQFWGLYSEFPQLFPQLFSQLHGELYFFGLHEADSPSRPSRNRNFYTPGFRLYRPPAPGQFDFELESVFQVGQSRSSSSSTNRTDLDHFAHYQHVAIGYTLAAPWSPRLLLQFDYASGDDNPNDDNNNRFDSLFGVPRFEFGPTSLYGAFTRSNLITPGYRFLLKPLATLNLVFGHRLNWLASDRDAWTTTGLRDPTGNTDSFLGHQLEILIRWDVFPGNVRLEVGGAYLFSGEFVDNAPNTNGEGNASYGYVQTVLTF